MLVKREPKKIKTAATTPPGAQARMTAPTARTPESRLNHVPKTARNFTLPLSLAAGMFVLAVTGVLFFTTSRPAATPVEGDDPGGICVAAPGLVESASGLRQLAFDVPGKLKRVAVDEGDRVAAGQLVAELENAPLAARVEAARAELAGARNRTGIRARTLKADVTRARQTVNQLKQELAVILAGPRKEELAAARAQVALAEAEVNGSEETRKRYYDASGAYEAWSKLLYSQAETLAAVAAAKLDIARARLQDMADGSRPEDIERARAKLAAAEADCECLSANLASELESARLDEEQSQAKFKIAQGELDRTRLFSPIGGTVIWKFMHAGEAIDALRNQGVIAVADQSHLRVRALVDEADYAAIFPGQSVRVTAEAFPGRTFKGRVELICDSAGEKPFSTGEARERHDVRVINVLVALEENQNLKLGLRVRAYFDSSRKVLPGAEIKK